MRSLFDNNVIEFALTTIFFLIALTYNIIKSKKHHKIISDFKNRTFLFWFVIIVLFTGYALMSKIGNTDEQREKYKESVRKAFSAFIIAYFARLDMIFAPFFFVFIFDFNSQFLGDWI